MTNEQIILAKRVELLKLGEIRAEADGTPEEIHTFNAWKSQGYIVRKGEHAVAKFPIWKYRPGKRKEAEGDEEKAQEKGYCYMRMAFFFTRDQVEAIA